MTYEDIRGFAPVNSTNPDRVKDLADSIREHGYVGSPILVAAKTGILVTGSHRLAALSFLAEEGNIDVWGMEVAEDVQDIVDRWCEENDATIDDIDFANLSNVFSGTRVEKYKDDLAEW